MLHDTVPTAVRKEWALYGSCPRQGLYDAFAAQVRAHGDRPAVRTPDGVLDYRQLDAYARQMAAALRALGAGPGDIVGIRLANDWPALAADLAVAAVGAVALPWPQGQGSSESHALLALSRARLLVSDTPLDRRHGPLPDLHHLVTADELLHGEPAGFAPAAVDPEDPARILVSSGSEAAPKMVAYSHNALLGGRGTYVDAVLRGAPEQPGGGTALNPAGVGGPDRTAGTGRNPAAVACPDGTHETGGTHPAGEPDAPAALVLAPLASSYGSLGLVALARCGATLHLLDRFGPEAALRAVTDWRPTHLVAVPTMLRRIADHPRVPGEDLRSLRAVVSSGAHLTAAVLAAALRRFGCPVTNVYGSSDGVNCRTTWADPHGDIRHVGRPDPRVTALRVCGPDDRPLPAGQPGEIQARGPMSPLCYVGAPDLDRRYRTSDGWVRSGDLGVVDPDGSLRVLDRLRRTVIRGGWTVSPAEVEEHLHAHPDVAEAACVPVPDADLGERLCACLVQHPGTARLDVDALAAYLTGDRGLARRKAPELVLHLDRLPLGATGKVCRRTLTAAARTRDAAVRAGT